MTVAAARKAWKLPYMVYKYSEAQLTQNDLAARVNNTELFSEDVLFEGRQALRRLIQGDDVKGKSSYLGSLQVIEDMKIEASWDTRVFFQRLDEMHALLPYTLWEAGAATGNLPREPTEEEKKAHLHKITSRSPAVKAWLESNGYNVSAMDPSTTITKIQDAQQEIDDQHRITQASTKILNGILNEGNGDSSRKRKQQEDPERDHSVDRFGRKKCQCKKCGRWVPQGKECYGFDGNGCTC